MALLEGKGFPDILGQLGDNTGRREFKREAAPCLLVCFLATPTGAALTHVFTRGPQYLDSARLIA